VQEQARQEAYDLMKQKPRWTLEMLTACLAILCVLLMLVLLVQRPAIWPVLVVLAAAWCIGMGLFRYRLRSQLARWVCGGDFTKSKTKFSLEPLSQPVVLLSGETVLWYNDQFRQRMLGGQDLLVSRVQKVIPGLDLQQARTQEGQQLTLADGVWSAHSSTVPGDAETMTLVVFNEETALRRVEAEYKASRPGYLVFLVDGYDDVFSDMLDSERARLLEGINRVLEEMIGRGTGFLRRVASGRYIAVVEERQLEQFAKRGYDVLDKIRALDPSVNLSLSIGIGRGAKTLREAQDMAVQALDMAQGRGGDQAAEMTPDGFTFYGGVSHGVEKRSKVRSRIVADQLVKLIKEADHVVIMGHRMSDLDAIGSAEGVLRICKICDVPAVIAVRRDATLASSLINALVAAGQEDDFIDPKGALPIISKRTLCIVVDTYQVNLVESKEILEKCGKVAVIDHHRKGVGFIENPALVCHEPYSSSASELVTELLQYVGERDDKPNRVEAEGLLAGIMLDTRDFTLHTGVRTFEAAAALRRYGAETERVRQLFDVTMVEYNAKADLVEAAQMYKNCAVSVSGEVPPEARVAIAQAANDLLTIQNVEASFVAVQVGTGVNISARSLGAVNVQVIMESLGGGGHQTMAAAQLKHITPEAARARIQTAIDQYRESQKKTSSEANAEPKKKDNKP
jgi:c-di-AMP phosphodiesterase-like protein